jgi:aspartate racemase
MLTIGLLGGMSWESSAHDYRRLNERVRERLEEHGLTVLVPDEVDRQLIHRVIFSELCVGVVREGSRQAYRGVMDRLVEMGAQGIVLGCTEIELLIEQADSPVPVFPTTRRHVEGALDAAFAVPAARP